MIYHNNKPLLNSGKISGYLIGEDIWNNNDITEKENKKVFLRWGNPNKSQKRWHSLSFLKFNYFQEIDESGKCFVGIQIDKLGHKHYRIFKTRISNLRKNIDIITYPAISSESYSDLQWLPVERVFKVFNQLGECSILRPPKWEQCNHIPFYESDYDPYSQFTYWPNTDFGHFKDFRFYDKILFGENYDGTYDIISSKGEIMSYAWSEVQITENGVSFRDKDKNFQKMTFVEIKNYYNRNLQERIKSLKATSQSNQDKCLENLTDKKEQGTNNADNDNLVADEKYEYICWLNKSFVKQFDNKTIQIKSPDRKMRPEDLVLCIYQKSNIKTAYIVRYRGHNIPYHPIERKIELTDEITGIRKLKSGNLSKTIPYNSQMSNDKLIESFKTIIPSFCTIQSEREKQDRNNSNQTETIPMTDRQENYSQHVSELMKNDFAEKIRQVYDFLSISFPSNKVFECLILLFGENIKNIKDYAPETDALIESAELNLASEIEREVNANKVHFLSNKQLDNFNASINYHTKVRRKSYMESLKIALTEIPECEELASYIENIKANLKRKQSENGKELTAKILKHILNVSDDSSNNTDETRSGNLSEICINNRKFKIGDIVHKTELLGNRRYKKFIRTGNYLLIFLSKAECNGQGIYEIRGEGEDGNQIKGHNANGDIADKRKRKIIITENPSNEFCKIFDEVIYVGENVTIESTNNKVRNVFHFKLKSIIKC